MRACNSVAPVAGTPGLRGPGRAGGHLVFALALALSLVSAYDELAAAPPAIGEPQPAVPVVALADPAPAIEPAGNAAPAPPAVERPGAREMPPPPGPVAPDPLRLSLMGTVAGQADGIAVEGIAIFVDQATQNVVRLKTGDRHGGWMLQSIRGRSAVLENGGRSETLTLRGPDQTVVQGVSPPANEPPASDGVADSIPNIQPAPLAN